MLSGKWRSGRKGELMALDKKARRRQLRQVAGALVHVEHPVAGGALEMVVVRLAPGFVARAVAGQGDSAHLLRIDQQLQVAVNGGQAQGRHFGLRGGQHFLGRERALRVFDGAADGTALAG